MNSQKYINLVIMIISLTITLLPFLTYSQDLIENPELDERVQQFLDEHRYQWRDLNIPASDGQLLYDLIVENGYTRALEIGTSTGHSATWIAWALSKTGGKLITIEIDEGRHREALGHFEEAGLTDYIDARLADAHELVPRLEGPFDFVFSDADKEWYTNYFKAVAPKLIVGGCYATHNVSAGGFGRGGRGMGGQNVGYYNYVTGLPNFESTLDTRGSGMLISFKKSNE
ncbi:class I SAM-dependent methyltransferase [bacterium]|nr:class I SAM-dependent methyltransferase [bacterium]RQV98034.1 MAG: methyltransferase [bacterium]